MSFERGAIRVVNYHTTAARHAAGYEAEFAELARLYAPVTEDTLAEYIATGRWSSGRLGIIPAFYNGYRDNFDVARPLLDRHGLVGWFFAVTGFTDCPAAEQAAFAAGHRLALASDYADGRHALSWDELAALEDGGHVVASHTRSHSRVTDEGGLADEIEGAQEDFRRNLGHPVRSFAWLLGGRYGENPAADACVDRAGYEFLFSNFAVQKLR